MNSLNIMRSKLLNPAAEFRSAPFWSWNDKLVPEELVRQIKEMKAQGMGGFFMHSREGLETEYMGTEWMDCIKAAVKAAEEEGMEAWIYDEDRWPSGAAGGLVPALGGDAYRSKGLTIEVRDQFTANEKESVLALFKGRLEGDLLLNSKRLDANLEYTAEPGEVLLVFRREISLPSEWFNGDAPSDNLNPDSVKAFIDTTYEVYKTEIGEQFGKAIPGVFTDEPNVAHRYCRFTGSRGWVPWTDGFIAYFIERRGYDLLEQAPFLFLEGEESTKIRHDYWRTLTERFCEAYSKQLGEWCEANELSFTGHYLFENEMGAGLKVSGSIMPHYIYQHVPGIDMLTEQIHENLTIKQCTSVANQYGRKRVLSETYACTGWDFDFEGQKWMGDWQFVMGVNLRCQHLALYSLKGCRKRDFPPVFSYNTSWWKYNHVIEDYFARLSMVLSDGDVIRDVLVLHPASTAWSMLGTELEYPGPWIPDKYTRLVNEFGESFNEFIRYMLGIHYDFDLGDEMLISQAGKVKEGKFYIELAGYSVIVLPPVQTLLASTVALLTEFMNTGGRVIAMGPAATMIEGRSHSEMPLLYSHKNLKLVDKKAEVLAELETCLPRKISIQNRFDTEEQAILYMLREHADYYSLFIVNNDREASHDLHISLALNGSVEEWDLLTAETRETEIEASIGTEKILFQTRLGPADSKLYIIDKNNAEKAQPASRSNPAVSTIEVLASLGPASKFSRTVENVLVLDKCAYRMGKGDWSQETDVWQAQKAVREQLGMRQVYYNGMPQRYKWINEPHANDGAPVELQFHFQVDKVPVSAVYLVLEAARHYSVQLNGQSVENAAKGWYIDRSFDKIELPGLIAGCNELVISCAYSNAMEMEDCYLIGDFGVDLERHITEEPKTIQFGDWCLQGYFHYCGSLVYHMDFHYADLTEGKVTLELGDYSAVTIEVRVNGATAGHIPWRAANRLDITHLLQQGDNQIDIEVMGSPRNLFGPLHQADEHNPWTDWRTFRREGAQYTPDYVVKAYGLFGQINICKRR